MERIANSDIQKLADSLASAVLPTADEIQNAMLLAYKMGKTDGAIELADRQLAKMGEIISVGDAA